MKNPFKQRAWAAVAVIGLVALPTASVVTASAFTDTAPTTVIANSAKTAIDVAIVTQPAAALLTADPAIDMGVSTITNAIQTAPVAATMALLASLFAIAVIAPTALRRRGRLQTTAHSLNDMGTAQAYQDTGWTTDDDRMLANTTTKWRAWANEKINGHGLALTGVT